MDNNEVNKYIKNDLERTREFPFKESLWDDMSKRLDVQDRKRAGFWWFWMLLGFLLASMIGMIFTILKPDNIPANAIQQQSLMVLDTTVKNVTIVKYDTIIQTVTIVNYEKIYQNINSNTNFNNLNTHLTIASLKVDLAKSKISAYTKPFYTINFNKNKNNYTNKLNTKGQTKLGIVNQIPKLNAIPQKLSVSRDDHLNKQILTSMYYQKMRERIIEKQNSFSSKLKRTFTYSGMNMGIGGNGRYSTLGNLNGQVGYGLGLSSQWQFGKHFRISEQISINSFQFQTDAFNPALGIPVINSPVAGYDFKSVDITRDIVRNKLGIDYYFLSNQRIRPYIGAGYNLLFYMPKILEYVYEKENSNNDINVVKEDLYKDSKFSHGVHINTGLEWKINSIFYLNTKGTIYYNFLSDNSLPVEKWGIQGGIVYKIVK